jgi:hypothetical protein
MESVCKTKCGSTAHQQNPNVTYSGPDIPPMQKLAKANPNHMIGRSPPDSHAKNRPFSLKIRHSIFLGKTKTNKKKTAFGHLARSRYGLPRFQRRPLGRTTE